MIFPPFTNLITDRLILRELQLSDAEQVFKIRSNHKVNEFLDREPAVFVKDSCKFIRMILKNQKKQQGMMWAITLKNDPTLIGTVVFWHIIKDKDQAEIGYELLPEHFGNGIMQEAVSKVIDFGFQTIGLQNIVAETKSNNRKSVNLLEKCGFMKTGVAAGEYVIFCLSAGSRL